MLENRFCFRISADARIAEDEKGNPVSCLNEVRFKGVRDLTQEQYDSLHQGGVKRMISNQTNIPEEFFECISQEEFNRNHESE